MSASDIDLVFEGWFQTRLPTDPDPTDEPRGVSGYTFALPGEPDFDRIIRFQDPPPDTVRSHAPQVGVTVTTVRRNGRKLPKHPLLGARVDLLDDPVHESRNYLMQEGWSEAIRPFHLMIEGAGVAIGRNDLLDPSQPDLEFLQAPQELIDRRGCLGLTPASRTVATASGVGPDLSKHLEKRHRALARDLKKTSDPMQVAGLKKRMAELLKGLENPADRRVNCLGWKADWKFELDGKPTTLEPAEGYAEVLGGRVDRRRNWPVRFWMGAWDPDVLCGYVKGTLTLPLLAPRRRAAAGSGGKGRRRSRARSS